MAFDVGFQIFGIDPFLTADSDDTEVFILNQTPNSPGRDREVFGDLFEGEELQQASCFFFCDHQCSLLVK